MTDAGTQPAEGDQTRRQRTAARMQELRGIIRLLHETVEVQREEEYRVRTERDGLVDQALALAVDNARLTMELNRLRAYVAILRLHLDGARREVKAMHREADIAAHQYRAGIHGHIDEWLEQQAAIADLRAVLAPLLAEPPVDYDFECVFCHRFVTDLNNRADPRDHTPECPVLRAAALLGTAADQAHDTAVGAAREGER